MNAAQVVKIEPFNMTQRARVRFEDIETDIRYIDLSGRLDILGVEQIEFELETLIAKARKSVIIDLSKVELMNSVGLGMLISNANALSADDKVMILLKPRPRVERVIRIAAIDQLLPIEYDLANALRRVRTNQK